MLNYTKVYVATMTSASTFSSVVDLSKPYEHVCLVVPTMPSGSLYIQVSITATTSNFLRITQGNPNQSTDFSINSAATQRIIPLPRLSTRYIRIENTSGVSDATTTFQLICAD